MVLGVAKEFSEGDSAVSALGYAGGTLKGVAAKYTQSCPAFIFSPAEVTMLRDDVTLWGSRHWIPDPCLYPSGVFLITHAKKSQTQSSVVSHPLCLRDKISCLKQQRFS